MSSQAGDNLSFRWLFKASFTFPKFWRRENRASRDLRVHLSPFHVSRHVKFKVRNH